MFHPTTAIAPTVEELAEIVLVVVDQTDPSSVYAHVAEKPVETSEMQSPMICPDNPPSR